ncbi:MAG: pantetheine-phosphate adenylyltransferase [Oscillospiraceae bacterium]|nr:pantetheine-phosphate adenylyltransferase [Oscillospiraceae bacterium]
MKTAIYPGSFDPLTYGHLDIIARAAKLADTLIVSVMRNIDKMSLFMPDERATMLRCAVDEQELGENIEIITSEGLVADLARGLDTYGKPVIIKGVRDAQDFYIEQQMAALNQAENMMLETLLLPANPQLAHLSSSAFKEFARYGGNLAHFAPDFVVTAVKKRITELVN